MTRNANMLIAFTSSGYRGNERYNGDERKDHQNAFEICDYELSQHQRNLLLIARIALGLVTGS